MIKIVTVLGLINPPRKFSTEGKPLPLLFVVKRARANSVRKILPERNYFSKLKFSSINKSAQGCAGITLTSQRKKGIRDLCHKATKGVRGYLIDRIISDDLSGPVCIATLL
ncbi:hypothetical protein [Altererythrobacter rubellus]|uniref:Uncharacterized protein n=1 Tax=Altererythrobacter rubellus TaxID=2173831 RepID=A0A9Y2F8K4_9SPHN|nr:hypothetical protein [Altererythrobacter rubellus]WIW95036.1 hypothetical protein QQX03_08680 [Altererythrobacter rubellus]